jgi:hypothetical protein
MCILTKKINIMKNLIVSAFLLLSISLFAQNRPTPTQGKTPQEMATETVKTLKTELSLTDKQEKELTDVLLTKFEKEDKARKQIQDARDQMRDANLEYDKKTKELLSTEQQEKLKEYEINRRQKPQRSQRPQNRNKNNRQ